MTAVPGRDAADCLLKAAYQPEESSTAAGFAGVFGRIATEYFNRNGDHTATLAHIAAKNHRNGMDNPYAHLRRDLGVDFCSRETLDNPIVAWPLKRSDCSPISDGAAAIVLANHDMTANLRRAVRFRAAVQVNDYLPMSRRDSTWFEGAASAWTQALDRAGLQLADVSFVETHDCFTIAELIQYEAMGLTARGDGARAINEGWTLPDGRLPINRSGGLKAKGHPVGATGVSMHVLAAMQLTGEAGAMQVPRAEIAGVFNMGGVAVANYVSILERSR